MCRHGFGEVVGGVLIAAYQIVGQAYTVYCTSMPIGHRYELAFVTGCSRDINF